MSQQCYRWVITINDPSKVSSEDGFTGQFPPGVLKDIFEDLSCSKWIYQLEQGKETGRFHYQGAFALKKKRTKSSLLSLISNLINIYLKDLTNVTDDAIIGITKNVTIAPMMDSVQGFDYSEKTDTRIRGPWSLKGSYYDGSDLPLLENFTHTSSLSLINSRLLSIIDKLESLDAELVNLSAMQISTLSSIAANRLSDDACFPGIR